MKHGHNSWATMAWFHFQSRPKKLTFQQASWIWSDQQFLFLWIGWNNTSACYQEHDGNRSSVSHICNISPAESSLLPICVYAEHLKKYWLNWFWSDGNGLISHFHHYFIFVSSDLSAECVLSANILLQWKRLRHLWQ